MSATETGTQNARRPITQPPLTAPNISTKQPPTKEPLSEDPAGGNIFTMYDDDLSKIGKSRSMNKVEKLSLKGGVANFGMMSINELHEHEKGILNMYDNSGHTRRHQRRGYTSGSSRGGEDTNTNKNFRLSQYQVQLEIFIIHLFIYLVQQHI